MHPGIFKVTFLLIPSKDRFSLFIQDLYASWSLCKGKHIFTHHSAHGKQCRLILFRFPAGRIKAAVLVLLKLPSPQTAEIHIYLSVIIHKDCRINAEASFNTECFRSERSFRFLCCGYAKAEISLLISCRKYQIIFSILIHHIRCPHLIPDPRNIILAQYLAMVDAGCIHTVHAEYMVVLHLVFIPVVIILPVMGNIVGWVNIKLIIKYMGRRICGVNMGYKGFSLFTHLLSFHRSGCQSIYNLVTKDTINNNGRNNRYNNGCKHL